MDELLKLFITFEARGDDKVFATMDALEKKARATEQEVNKHNKAVASSYDELAGKVEKSSKRVQGALGTIASAVGKLNKDSGQVKIGVTVSGVKDAKEAIDELCEKRRECSGTISMTAEVNNVTEALAEIKKIKDARAEVDGSTISLNVRVNTATLKDRLEAVRGVANDSSSVIQFTADLVGEEELKTKLDALKQKALDTSTTVTIGGDASGLDGLVAAVEAGKERIQHQLSLIGRSIGTLRANAERGATFKVHAVADGFDNVMRALGIVDKKAEEVDDEWGRSVHIHFEADDFEAVMGSLRALGFEARRIDDTTIEVDVDWDSADAEAKAQRLRGFIDYLNARGVNIDVDFNAQQALGEAERLNDTADDMDGRTINMEAEAETAGATAGLNQVDDAADEVDGRTATVKADADTGGALAAIKQLQLAVQGLDTGLSAGGMRIVAIAGMAAAAASMFTPLVGALASVGAMGATAAAGVGLIMGPLSAVVGRLQEYHSGLEEAATAQDSASSAADAYAAAQQNAAQVAKDGAAAIADAEANLESVREDGAEAIAAAERDLADTRRTVAENNAQAEEDVETAREGVESATESLIDAEKELADIRDGDEARNQEQAEIDLEEARLNAAESQRDYNKAVKEHGKNSAEARQAALDLRQAELDLAEQQEETNEIRAQGSEELNNAKEAVKTAADEQQDAIDGVTDAEKNRNRVAAEGRRQIIESRRAVAEATETAAENEKAAAQAVTKAEMDAAQANREAAQAVKDAYSEMQSANEKVAAAVASLSPAQKALYDTAIRAGEILNRVFGQAQDDAARIGVTIIRDLIPTFRPLAEASERTIAQMSASWTRFANMMRQPVQQESAATLLGITPAIFGQLTQAAGRFFGFLLNVLAIAAPSALRLATWINNITGAMLKWSQTKGATTELTAGISAAQRVFSALWGAVVKVSAALWQFGLDNAPHVARAIELLGSILAGIIWTFDKLTQQFGAIIPLTMILSPLIVGAMLVFGQLGTALINVVWALIRFGSFLGLTAGILTGPWAIAIAAVVAGAILLAANWGRVRNALAPLQPVIQRVGDALRNLGTVLRGVFTGNTNTDAFKKAFDALPESAQNAISRLRVVLNGIKIGLQNAWNQVKPILAAIGNGLKRAFGAALPAIVSSLKRFGAQFRTSFNQIKTTVGPVISAIGNALRRGLGAAFQAALRAAQGIVNWFKRNWPLISRTANTVWKAFERQTLAVIRGVARAIQTTVKGIVRWWQQNHKSIENIARQVWDFIKNTVSSTLKFIGHIVKSVMHAINGDWGKAWQEIQKAASVIMNWLTTSVRQLFSALGSLFMIAGRTLNNIWVNEIWNPVKNFVGTILKNIREEITTSMDGIRQTFWNAVDPITNAFRSIGEGMLEGIVWAAGEIERVTNNILNFIADVAERVGLDGIAADIRPSGGTSGEKKQAEKGLGPGSPAAGARPDRRRRLASGGRIARGEQVIVGDAPGEYVVNPHRRDNARYIAQAAADYHRIHGSRGDRQPAPKWGRHDSDRKPGERVAYAMPPKQAWDNYGGDNTVGYTASGDLAGVLEDAAAQWDGAVVRGGDVRVNQGTVYGGAIGRMTDSGEMTLEKVDVATAAHELGHALGLAHAPDGSGSIMEPTISSSMSVTDDDIAAIKKYYGAQTGGGDGEEPSGDSPDDGGGGTITQTQTGGGPQTQTQIQGSGGGGTGGGGFRMPLGGGFMGGILGGGGGRGHRGGHGDNNRGRRRRRRKRRGGLFGGGFMGGMFAHGEEAYAMPRRKPQRNLIGHHHPDEPGEREKVAYLGDTIDDSEIDPSVREHAEKFTPPFSYNSYIGHGEPGGSTQDYTYDLWGPGGRGDDIRNHGLADQGYDAMQDATSHTQPTLLYGIAQDKYWRDGNESTWSSSPYYDGMPHLDHTHLSYVSPTGSGEGGGGSFNPLRGIAERAWDATVQPKLDDLNEWAGGANAIAEIGAGLVDKTANALKDKIIDALPLTGSSGTNTGGTPSGELEQWAHDGLAYGGRFDPSDENIAKISELAMKESGGDPNAQNPDSSAAGLMQVIDSTFAAFRVKSSDDVFNPVHNVAASSRYQGEQYGELVTFSPYSEGGMTMGDQFARLGEEGREFVLPLDNPRVEDAARQTFGTTMLADAFTERIDALENALVDRLGYVGIDRESQFGIGAAGAEVVTSWGNSEKGLVQMEKNREKAERRKKTKGQ